MCARTHAHTHTSQKHHQGLNRFAHGGGAQASNAHTHSYVQIYCTSNWCHWCHNNVSERPLQQQLWPSQTDSEAPNANWFKTCCQRMTPQTKPCFFPWDVCRVYNYTNTLIIASLRFNLTKKYMETSLPVKYINKHKTFIDLIKAWFVVIEICLYYKLKFAEHVLCCSFTCPVEGRGGITEARTLSHSLTFTHTFMTKQ